MHSAPDIHPEPPLVIDLDGTLLCSDLLLETGLAFVRAHPARLPCVLLWLTHDQAKLEQALAQATHLDVSRLPFDLEIIELIEAERRKGRRIVLATTSHRTLAERVAEHLQLFDEIIASDADRNLSAERKEDVLVQRFGEGGFDYAGNAHEDLPVWRAARRSYVVNPEHRLERLARQLDNLAAIIRSNRSSLRDWAKALRLHQWAKNLLIFVPLLAAHRLTEVALVGQGLLAFLLFGLCASSVYLLNDLLDLGDDRHHATKRHRPFAAGRLSIRSGLIAIPTLLLAAFAGALWFLPWAFAAVLAAYYALTLAYSLALKRRMVIDVIALASLYTLRIIAGSAALAIPLSFWVLAFSMFMFLSLAIVKRYAELRQAREKGHTDKTRGRGYYPSDLEMLASLGGSSGYVAVMVLALYINDLSATALYHHPEVIWLACPLLLLWITRVWMLTHRGQMHDDPVVFAIRDRTSLVIGALFGLIFWIAT
ncbi:UbiA family prenyltransferase [Thiorhodococcus fuscus]|uniref:UbiA family prenyltransferase n=1 Tax=Thiorhodococcus fuscus TaxID=527200 RepID=A0ABW4Y813_9GAMM